MFGELEYFEQLVPGTVMTEWSSNEGPGSAVIGEGPEATDPPTGRRPTTFPGHRGALRRSELVPAPPRRRSAGVSRAVFYAVRAAIALLSMAAIIVVATHLPLVSVADRPARGSDPLFGRRATIPSRTPAPDAPSSSSSGIRGVEVYANGSGGYLFSYPETWTVDERGEEAFLTSPDDSVRVVFGSEEEGSLAQVSTSLVEGIARSHRGVEILTSSRESTDQGLRALIVGGIAQQDGVEGRFLAISLGRSGVKKVITVFFPSGSDVLRSAEAIRAILSSYRVETTSSADTGLAGVIVPAG